MKDILEVKRCRREELEASAEQILAVMRASRGGRRQRMAPPPMQDE